MTPTVAPTVTPTATPDVEAAGVTIIKQPAALLTAVTPGPTQPTDRTPEVVQIDRERPIARIIDNAVPRIRNALTSIATSPRQRTTLIIILIIAGILAIGAFAYLIFRRR